MKGGPTGKGPNHASSNLEVATKCGDMKVLVDAMKAILCATSLNTRQCALKGSKLFGSTKSKLDLPPGADYDSH